MKQTDKSMHSVQYSTEHVCDVLVFWVVTLVNLALSLSARLALDVPDSLYRMEEAEGAQDPFFGLMESHQLPSPYKIHQVH